MTTIAVLAEKYALDPYDVTLALALGDYWADVEITDEAARDYAEVCHVLAVQRVALD